MPAPAVPPLRLLLLTAAAPISALVCTPGSHGPACLPSCRRAAEPSRSSDPRALSSANVQTDQPAEAIELRELLVSGGDVDRNRADALIDALSAMRVPCPVGKIGEGLWRSSYTRGPKPKWQRNMERVKFVNNKAGQTYDAQTGRVINYAEVLGPSVHFFAKGQFNEVEQSETMCPKDFSVSIECGGLVVLGREFLSGAISGPGSLRVLYLDPDIRILDNLKDTPDGWETAGLQIVQVRDQLFDAADVSAA